MFANGQAQARGILTAMALHLIEALEDARQIVRRDEHAVVHYADDHVVAFHPARDADGRLFFGIAAGVLQQVAEHQRQQTVVGQYGGQFFQMAFQTQLAFLQAGLAQAARLIEGGGAFRGAELQGASLPFHTGQYQQILQHAGQRTAVTVDDGRKVLRLFRGIHAEQGLGIALDGGQRRAQLMGDIGHEIAADALQLHQVADVAEDQHRAQTGIGQYGQGDEHREDPAAQMQLHLAQCASPIGITNNPSIYDPYLNPEKNKERQEIILGEMLSQGYITQKQYDEAKAEELVFVRKSTDDSDADEEYYSYFEDQVIRDVVNDLCDKTGYDYDIVYKMVMTGGYQIYSTYNPDAQAAVDAVYEDLSQIPETASSQQLQSGIVIIDNETGDIVAMAGGVGKKTGSLTLNRAAQSLLSPGSTIKPVSVYAPAIELGLITPATVYDDTPYSFTDNSFWPKNSDSTFRGLVSINEAMMESLNTVPVKLVAEMTPEYCYQFAKEKMGLSTLVSDYVTSSGEVRSDVNLAPMALGGLTNGVTVRAMAAAYASFADEGVYRTARTYTKVTDASGKNIILDNTQNSYPAMKDMTAWYITDMLENTVNYGTGYGAKLENMTVAGKTGTTTSDFDRWFAGYTPYYTGVVWCGYDDPEEVVLTNSETNPAVVLWQKVMSTLHTGLANKEFAKPTNVVECTVCRDSGKLVTDACKEDPRGSRAVKVQLSLYDVPTENCDVHTEVEICDASGHTANEYCALVDGNTTHNVGLLNISRAFPTAGIVVLDQSYVVPNDSLPAGYYAAVAPDVDAINVSCYIHDADDLPKKEEPEPDEDEQSDPDDEDTTEPDLWNADTGLNP